MTQITARDFMVTNLITIAPEADVLDAVQLLLKHRISGAPVVAADGRYLGVFSEKCSMHVLLDAAYEQLPVSDVRSFMDVEAQTIGPETHLLSVAQVLLPTPARRVPVLEDGQLLGFAALDTAKANIDAVYVAPKCWRQGIGRQLLIRLEEIALAAGLSRLSLQAAGPAIRFYLRQGYISPEELGPNPSWAEMEKRIG